MRVTETSSSVCDTVTYILYAHIMRVSIESVPCILCKYDVDHRRVSCRNNTRVIEFQRMNILVIRLSRGLLRELEY